jgi:uncharacterized membrane protein
MIIDILWAWIEAFLRWLHVIAGIAWIGSSFFFMHLDYSLRRRDSLPERAHGDAWQVHGGGFYHMVKYLVAPSKMPDQLTWHKWEAYTTWLSGFALLVVVYYLSAELYLIDRNVLDLPVWAAVAASVGTLAVAWVAYDLACRSRFGTNDVGLALVMFVVLLAMAFALTFVFSARGAFMQMGAIMGTIMVANVAMVIIPGQRKVVADLVAGRQPDAIHGARGKQRSTHNNYLTLATVFVMFAGHYPLAFGTRFSWLILGCLIVMGVLMRHFFNERHKGNPDPWWTWGVTAALGLVVVWLSTFPPVVAEPQRRAQSPVPSGLTTRVSFAQVDDVIQTRCAMCHAREPVWSSSAEVWQRPMGQAPKDLRFDTPDAIHLHRRAIGLHSVASHAMPPGNISVMTPEERRLLGRWLTQSP